jgi:acetyl esterase/lipase
MFEKDLEQVFEKLNVPNFNVRERIQKQKLLVSGESAGGFLAVHALIASRGDPPADISALYLQYPMLGHYTRKSVGKYRDIDIDEKELQKFADDRMKKIEYLRNDGRLQTRFASNPPEGMDMAYMLSSTKAPDGNGSYWKYWFGGDDMLEETQKLIVDNPEESQKWGCPRIFITHGKNDVNCPSTDSEKFIEMIEKVYPGKSTLVLLDGKAHAFDYSCEVGDVEHEDWLPDLVNMMKMAWDPDFCPGKSVKKLQDIEGKQTIKGLRE